MQNWQLQEAKSKLSALVRKVWEEGPQKISVNGKNAVVMLSEKQYESLKGKKQTLASFLRKSPLSAIYLDVTRDKSADRPIKL